MQIGDVRSISEAKFPHHKSKSEVVTEKLKDDQDGTDGIEEPWRQQLLGALMKMNPKKIRALLPWVTYQNGNRCR